jgi:hypothetical protein
MRLLNKLFKYVALTTVKHNIDESHGMFHAMEILQFAASIYKTEKVKNPFLERHERIIYVSSILHDMCDKKYMNEKEGIESIEEFLQEKIPKNEIEVTKQIISTMSYSTVKNNGFPDLQEYQLAYHIVREADLLCAYDFDRAIIYNMYKTEDKSIHNAFEDAENIFNSRILKQLDDELLKTDFSIKTALVLQNQSLIRMEMWREMIKNPLLSPLGE